MDCVFGLGLVGFLIWLLRLEFKFICLSCTNVRSMHTKFGPSSTMIAAVLYELHTRPKSFSTSSSSSSSVLFFCFLCIYLCVDVAWICTLQHRWYSLYSLWFYIGESACFSSTLVHNWNIKKVYYMHTATMIAALVSHAHTLTCIQKATWKYLYLGSAAVLSKAMASSRLVECTISYA